MYITLSLTNILTNYLLEPGTALRYIHEQCSLDEQGVAEYCSKPSKLHACLFVLIYGGWPSICAACVCVYCVATLHIIFLGNCNATTYTLANIIYPWMWALQLTYTAVVPVTDQSVSLLAGHFFSVILDQRRSEIRISKLRTCIMVLIFMRFVVNKMFTHRIAWPRCVCCRDESVDAHVDFNFVDFFIFLVC